MEGSFCCWSEEANCLRYEAEEVEIPRTPVYSAMHDEGGTTGKSEIFGLWKTGDDPGYSLLESGQQSGSIPWWRSIHSFQAFRTAGGSTKWSKSSTSVVPSM